MALARCSAHVSGCGGEGGPLPAYLREQQSALAGLETLGALGVQLGVTHLFASVSVRKSRLGNRRWPVLDGKARDARGSLIFPRILA